MLIPDPHDFQRMAKNRLLSLHKGCTAPSRKAPPLTVRMLAPRPAPADRYPASVGWPSGNIASGIYVLRRGIALKNVGYRLDDIGRRMSLKNVGHRLEFIGRGWALQDTGRNPVAVMANLSLSQ